jgi:superfamily I DNA/RNA helicase
MNSNIFLKSNIYISNDEHGYILYDDNYLSNIQSVTKMAEIREKHILRSLPRYWSDTQQIYFESGDNNPHTGIVISGDKYIFIHNIDIPKENFIEYDPSEYNYIYSIENYNLHDQFISNINSHNYEDDIGSLKIVGPVSDLNTAYVSEINTDSLLLLIPEYNKEYATTVAVIDDGLEREKEQKQSDTNIIQNSQTNKENIFSKFLKTEQKDIIEADHDNVIFIDAGPGTGKTYILIQRIQYLVVNCGISADEVQVLCFTNAAVNEIKERLNKIIKNGGDRSLANVDIRTFHSFAWWLIAQANELRWQYTNMHNLNYDLSIKKASEIMKTYYSQIVGNWKHFIVDEIQDLTNYLARFVLYIVNACLKNKDSGKGTGITILGDYCQAIYDYTLKDENIMSSQVFYECLDRKINDIGLFCGLSKNHRQTEDLMTSTTGYRNSILSQDKNNMKNEIKYLFQKFDEIKGNYLTINVKELVDKFADGNSEVKICFMCRNNAQTLKLSSAFRKRGIEHTLNVNTTERNYAAWISEIFYYYDKKVIERDIFIDRYNSFVGNKTSKSPEEIWERILYMTKSSSSVYISDLLERIASSRIDDICFRHMNESNILVSNIHKTKGREYDHVIIDQYFVHDLMKNDNDIGEYKTLYVALTRPKTSIYYSTLSDTTYDGYMKRYTIYDTRRKILCRMNKKRQVVSFELRSNLDIDIESFLTASIDVQNYIKLIKIGDSIELKRVRENGMVIYKIIHYFEDRPQIIGKLNNFLIEDISALMHLSETDYIKLPERITNLYVSGIYAYIATEDHKKIYPEIIQYSPHGVWLWVEFIGIGLASYDTY